METHESYGIAPRLSKEEFAEIVERAGTPVLDTPSSSSIDNIPSWCKKIFDEEQKDPDKDPGFLVTARLWSKQDDLLIEQSFMHVGQDKEKLTGTCAGTGRVDRCIVYWKGKDVKSTHNMHDLIVAKGDHFELTISNLRMIG